MFLISFGRGLVLPPVLPAPEPVSQYYTALQVQTMEGDLPRRHEGATTAGEYDERHICNMHISGFEFASRKVSMWSTTG